MLSAVTGSIGLAFAVFLLRERIGEWLARFCHRHRRRRLGLCQLRLDLRAPRVGFRCPLCDQLAEFPLQRRGVDGRRLFDQAIFAREFRVCCLDALRNIRGKLRRAGFRFRGTGAARTRSARP